MGVRAFSSEGGFFFLLKMNPRGGASRPGGGLFLLWYPGGCLPPEVVKK